MDGNECLWRAYLINPKHPEVAEFLSQITPQIELDVNMASELVMREQYEAAQTYLKKGYFVLT